MLLGMFVVWITPNGAFWGFLAGMLSSFSMFLAVKFNWISASVLTLSREASDMSANFWRAWWAWLICLVVTVVVSLVTKPKAREELIGLVKGLTPIEVEKNLPFYKKPEVMALFAIVLFVLLNVYFW